jgi:hypothetical protein
LRNLGLEPSYYPGHSLVLLGNAIGTLLGTSRTVAGRDFGWKT